MTTLAALEPILQAQLAELAPKSLVPGYVAAVYHAGRRSRRSSAVPVGLHGWRARVPGRQTVPLTSALFGVAGAPPEMFYGVWGRMGLVSFHQPGPDGRFTFMHTGWRAARRSDV